MKTVGIEEEKRQKQQRTARIIQISIFAFCCIMLYISVQADMKAARERHEARLALQAQMLEEAKMKGETLLTTTVSAFRGKQRRVRDPLPYPIVVLFMMIAMLRASVVHYERRMQRLQEEAWLEFQSGGGGYVGWTGIRYALV